MADGARASGRRRPPLEIPVEVHHVEQLFEAPAFDFRHPRPRVAAGLEEAYAATRTGDHRRPVRLAVRLPAASMVGVDAVEVGRGIAAYCELRAVEVEREKAAHFRDGRHSLGIGVAILAAGLIISQAIHHAALPEELDTFLGDGLFLVIAWVGLWYPLDTMLYSRREAGRRAAAWRALERADVTLEAVR